MIRGHTLYLKDRICHIYIKHQIDFFFQLKLPNSFSVDIEKKLQGNSNISSYSVLHLNINVINQNW